MTDMTMTRRLVIRSILTSSLAVGFVALSGCGGGDESFPVIPTNKNKDELSKDLDNPFDAPDAPKKSKKRKS
jgi:hypothetical protein